MVSEHFAPDIGERRALWAARNRFLKIVDELYPEVRKSLRDRVWMPMRSSCNELLEEDRLSTPPNNPGDWYQSVPASFADVFYAALEAGDGRARQLQDALHSLLDEKHLNCDWIAEAAVETIDAWHGGLDPEVDSGWILPGAGIWTPLNPAEKQFSFSESWEPASESRRDAQKRILDSFRKRLEGWMRETESLAISRGFVETPESRKEEVHLRWLAQFQVGMQSPEDIFRATEEKVQSFQAIAQAVNRVADRIGLPRRTGKRGPAPRP